MIERAGVIIYKKDNNKIKYLFVSMNENSNNSYLIPQGHIEENETPYTTAIRESEEESGAVIEIERNLGFQIHKAKEKIYKTYIFLAKYIKQCTAEEKRKIIWLTNEQINNIKLFYPTKKIIDSLDKEISSSFMNI